MKRRDSVAGRIEPAGAGVTRVVAGGRLRLEVRGEIKVPTKPSEKTARRPAGK